MVGFNLKFLIRLNISESKDIMKKILNLKYLGTNISDSSYREEDSSA